MNADLTTLLTIGVLAVLGAATVLALLVRGDLAPRAGSGVLANDSGRAGPRDDGGRWFIVAGLGMGIFAFSLKLAVIVALQHFPQQTIGRLKNAAVARVAEKVEPETLATVAEPVRSFYVWATLPAMVPAPADNPTTPAKIALGEILFNDTALSLDHTISCASCHDITGAAGADGRSTAIGIHGTLGHRNAPTVFNAAFQARLFWDGRAASLEDQAMGPPLNPDEMGMPSPAAIEERFNAAPRYRSAFANAFGENGPISMRRIVQAIAAYERSLITRDTPYDRFVQGDSGAMSVAQQRGMALFQAVGCVNCHSGPNFSGAALVGPKNPFVPLFASRSALARSHDLAADKGRAVANAQNGVWRVPSLRNVALTAPYFHNGSVDNLPEAVRVMATAQLGAEITEDARQRRVPVWARSPRGFVVNGGIVLDGRDIDDITAFLGALSSDFLAARVARK